MLTQFSNNSFKILLIESNNKEIYLLNKNFRKIILITYLYNLLTGKLFKLETLIFE